MTPLLWIRSALSRPTLSAPALTFLTLVWIVAIDNLALWTEVGRRLDLTSLGGAGYAITLSTLMVLLLLLPTLLLVPRVLLKPILVALLLLSGAMAYFIGELGVIFDVDMIRNLVETLRDRNVQEGAELVSGALVSSLLLTVAFPVWIVTRTRITHNGFRREILRRITWSAAMTSVVLTLAMMNFRSLAYVSRENHDLEAWLNPHFPIAKTHSFVTRTLDARSTTFVELGADATRNADPQQRTVGVIVVGETARADHLSLNDYKRDTNPELSVRTIVNFPDVTSCGTSTAYSVPCMFSFLNAESYTPEKANAQSNVLDVIARTGVDVTWIDNNSSCKGVCDRLPSTNLTREPDPASPLFVEGAWLDEVLLERLDQAITLSDELATTEGFPKQDVLIVLHAMGSHGPAYYRRVPDRFARFTPYCRNKAPQDCPLSETINAYDNTILYTDHILASIIDLLENRREKAFMFYASDHGESLGENGIFLHGLPRFMAPRSQTHVPMMAWFSKDFVGTSPVNSVRATVRQDSRSVSHDNLSATLLGLYDVRTSLYKPSLDLFPKIPVQASQPLQHRTMNQDGDTIASSN